MVERLELHVVIIGHVDHGKSTLMGRLFADMGLVRKEQIEAFRVQAQSLGKTTFEYAWVFDRAMEERQRGITISAAHEQMTTSRYVVTVVDAPGHRDFIKNMIMGTSEADAGVLVVAVDEGIKDQTREHALLAKVYGVNQLIIVINKMDKVGYNQSKFEALQNELESLLLKYGFRKDELRFVPVAALPGDNIVKPSPNMRWWKGPTFLETFDLIAPPQPPISAVFRMPITEVFSIAGAGTVAAGKVDYGTVKKGDKVVVRPIGKESEVRSIQEFHREVIVAGPGSDVGIALKGIEKKDIRTGSVLGSADHPPTCVKEFTARITVLEHGSGIHIGYHPILHVHSAHQPVQVVKLVSKLDPATGKELEKGPTVLNQGDLGVVEFRSDSPLVIEKATEFPRLGRFAIRDASKTVGIGICVETVPLPLK